jgi:GNAT superfamily N-acetyltransferase
MRAQPDLLVDSIRGDRRLTQGLHRTIALATGLAPPIIRRMTPEQLAISIEPQAPVEMRETIGRLLGKVNTDLGYPPHFEQMCAALRDSHAGIQGGVVAESFWGWLHVSTLVVCSTYRGRGHGRRLLTAAEGWGRERGCHDTWLTTTTFQARGFYEHLGYSVFAELPDYPSGQILLFMRRRLI